MDWFITTMVFLFLVLVFVSSRIFYIKGYRAGARMVLKEWKTELNEGEQR